MKKKLIILAFVLIILVIFWLIQKDIFFGKNQENEIQINGQKILVEVSQTPNARQKGLSGRENICENCGMLFIFETPQKYTFWMKEMRFNLDMIWIYDNQVLKIVKNIPFAKGVGEVIDPQIVVDKVLEINAGKSDEWGIKEGDEVIFDLK